MLETSRDTEQPRNAKDIAMGEIVQLVISHRYAPGDRILETALSEELKMSRTPVREALSSLESTGFLEKVKNQKGYQVPFLTADDMKQVFHARAILESDTAYFAAQCITDSEIEYLENINRIEKAAYNNKDRGTYSDANERFHMNLVGIAGNPYVARYTRELYWRSSLYNFFFASFYSFGPIQGHKDRLASSEHQAIINAFKEHDGENASLLMREHIMSTYRSMTGPDISLLLPKFIAYG